MVEAVWDVISWKVATGVFLSHQIGGFLGVWLGGRMYDLYGDYTMVWWVGVGVGAFSAIVHLPIREDRTAEPVPA